MRTDWRILWIGAILAPLGAAAVIVGPDLEYRLALRQYRSANPPDASHEPGGERGLLSPALSSAASGGDGARRAGEEEPRFIAPMRAQMREDALQVNEPPEKGFFSKELDFETIPIKAHRVVSDAALFAARDRLRLLFADLGPYRSQVLSNLANAGVELHIIGRDQVTTDLPEWRHDKGKHLPEYNGLTRDERTRGMGGRLVSCGEENLLRLAEDRYRGRDICIHEFAHAIRSFGMSRKLRARFDEQYRQSLARGRWPKAYAASNPGEFFAELSMWYFGSHGDLRMAGPKPGSGRDGLRDYDPEAFRLFDEFYTGRADP